MSNNWPDWFADRIKLHSTPDAYYLEAASYERPLISSIRSILPPPATLLEVGCGLGVSASLFSSEGYDVLAIDNDTKMLQLAYEAPWKSLRNGSVKFDIGDAYNLPRGFDVATSLGIVEHVSKSDRHLMLKELVVASRIAVVSIPSRWTNAESRDMGEHDITLRQLVTECHGAGWYVLRSFGWGIPNQFRRAFSFIPPIIQYTLQRFGYCCSSLCVIGRHCMTVFPQHYDPFQSVYDAVCKII